MESSESFPVNTVLDAVLSKLRALAETGQTFGNPITVGDTTIVPYVSLKFGLGGGGGGASFGNPADVDSSGATHNQEVMNNLGTWGGAGGGVKVEPMGFLVIRGESVEMLPIERGNNQWAAIAEGVMPMLEQWLEERSQVPSELE